MEAIPGSPRLKEPMRSKTSPPALATQQLVGIRFFANTAGNLNTGVGAGTLLFNAGDNNTATGALALLNNTSGFYNTADGAFTLLSNTEGSGNTASGYQALYSNEAGNNNAAYGFTALYNNTGDFNTALGSQTLVYNTGGAFNTATGYQALVFNTQGAFNTAIGHGALFANTEGNFNVAIGHALASNTTGIFNIAIGPSAGANLTTGSNNIDIGPNVLGLAGEANTIRIRNSDHNAIYVAGIAGQTVGAGGTTCYVDNVGKLGVFLSARRYKENIQPMNEVSSALFSLKPVSFRYKPEFDKSGTPHFGLIAEEVAKVAPDLVTRDAKGQLSTVRYEAVNAMLLNEFLKEHRTVQEQGGTIAELKKQVAILTAAVKEQAAQIQKVSAQVEVSRLAPQTVKNTD
jgi:trimeric autotransporter adhesin